MKRYELNREQIIDRPRNQVFSFFERPENLARITPPSMRFRILTPGPITMAAGALIDYTVRIFGIRRRWTTRIESYDRPNEFVDVQLRGPYTFWRHTHRFEDVTEGTRMIDRVDYIVPFGLSGRLAHKFFIKRRLRDIFDYRSRKIREIFGSEHSSRSDPAGEKVE